MKQTIAALRTTGWVLATILLALSAPSGATEQSRQR